ncbi:MAG: hypothetical protein JWO78_540 [Micavibrio sp.]|nr:hypothetical protein [Micavibrio sp.]
MQSSLVEIFWRSASPQIKKYEIKDPTIVPMPDGTFTMYASVFGPDIKRGENIGRFRADHPKGPWTQIENPRLHGFEDNGEACAPQVLLRIKNGQPEWTMFVQTSFSQADGVIIEAVSANGIDFYPLAIPSMTKNAVQVQPVVGVYDVSVADIHYQGQDQECMVFSGYRKVGCGDLYASLRVKGGLKGNWSAPVMTQEQEALPFHNKPGGINFEWGVEGGKIHQLGENSFLQIGVCFLEKDVKFAGTRQRVFFSLGKTPFGPFESHSLPLEPIAYDAGKGENGHPDIIDIGGKLALVYQERAGAQHPWHLRYAEISRDDLNELFARPAPP